MRSRELPIAILMILLSCSFVSAGSQPIVDGIDYLLATQNPDGSWGDDASGAEILPSTIAAIETLKALNQADTQAYSDAILWLQSQDLETTEYYAERIHALLVGGTERWPGLFWTA
jgi:hypothetical protein